VCNFASEALILHLAFGLIRAKYFPQVRYPLDYLHNYQLIRVPTSRQIARSPAKQHALIFAETPDYSMGV
jgi:hypothetical protein